MPLRDDAVKTAHKQVFIKSHIHGITPDEAYELAAMILTAASQVNEPAFEPGQAYQDYDGDVFMRNAENNGWVDEYGQRYRDGFATRPLVRLVPESEVN